MIIDPILRFFRVTDKASLAETNYSGSENFDTLAIYSFVYDFIALKVIPCRINLRTIKMKLYLWVSKLCKFEQLKIQKLSLYYCVANSIYRSVPLVLASLVREYGYNAGTSCLPNFFPRVPVSPSSRSI